MFSKVRHKNNCARLFSDNSSLKSLVNPDSTILMPKDGFCWCRLLVNLAPRVASIGCHYVINNLINVFNFFKGKLMYSMYIFYFQLNKLFFFAIKHVL